MLRDVVASHQPSAMITVGGETREFVFQNGGTFFGMVNGFGFASALQEVHLSRHLFATACFPLIWESK